MYGAFPGELSPRSFGVNEKKHRTFLRDAFLSGGDYRAVVITVTLLQSMHGALPVEQNPHSVGLNEKSTTRFRVVLFVLVEITGIEPVTSCMPCKRSPS